MQLESNANQYPLSRLQQGLLYHAHYADHTTAYITQLIVTLREKINIGLLWQAWEKVIERHEILRSYFAGEDVTNTLQHIAPEINIPTQFIDYSELSTAKKNQQLKTFLKTDIEQNFDLSQAPLLRLTLIKLAEDEYRLIWTHHYLLIGGKPINLVLNEVFAIYDALNSNKTLSLTPPPAYQNYIDHLQQFDREQAQAYWRQLLLGFKEPNPILLPERAVKGEIPKSSIPLQIPLVLCRKLSTFAEQNAITLNSLIQGAWGILLARYSASDDVVFGAVRSFPTQYTENLVGLFLNNLPVRVHIRPQTTVMQYLQEIRAQHRKLREFIHTSLVEIREWSDIPSQFPLFETVVDFKPQAIGAELQAQGGLWATREINYSIDTNYPLNLEIWGEGEHLRGRLNYSTQRFEVDSMQRLVGHYLTLLHNIVSNPEQLVTDLTILSKEEQQKILQNWNATATQYPSNKCIHQLFEEQAQATPDATAIILADDTKLTYQQLNIRANQFAHYLMKHGVGRERIVAVCLEQSAQLIIALLAILKAGGAYVPLDVNYPQERLHFMLQDTHALLLLTQPSYATLFAEYHDRIVSIDLDPLQFSHENSDNPVSKIAPHNLAYLIYTSGSTGKPKGVMIEHRGVVRLVKNTNYIEFNPQDHIAQASNISFDAATFEIWGALLNGAALAVISKDNVLIPEIFINFLQKQRITTLWLTARLFDQIILANPHAFAGVKNILIGGEALNPSIVGLALKNPEFAPQRLLNGYGPTENTTFTTTHLIDYADTEHSSIPIGKPIANTKVFILDKYLQPQPIGIPGELYVGGDGLARGYLNRPELTAQIFIQNPFNNDVNDRLYKTGDLCRYLPDSNIEFIERVDHQVKLRGFRIELDEIEAVISQQEFVSNAVVIAQENESGEKYLAAYFVSKQKPADEQQASENSEQLQQLVKSKLPDYMVPSFFIELEQIPLTPNGKVDRKALPKPTSQQYQRNAGYVAPRTSNEEILASIWADVLSLKKVGVFANFFDLGGHSLRASQIIVRIRKAFNVSVPLRILFERPTIAGLLDYIESQEPAQQEKIPELVAIDRNQPLPLSYPERSLWVLQQLDPSNPFYNEPFVVKLNGKLSKKRFEKSINKLIARHEVLRTVFSEDNETLQQKILPSLEVPLKQHSFFLLPLGEKVAEGRMRGNNDKIHQFLIQLARIPFDLTNGPLLRTDLVKTADNEYYFLLNLHHIICDGWSMDVFMRELAAIYNARSQKKSAQLTPLTIQYADFAAWQDKLLKTERLQKQLNYWKQQLGDAELVLEFPTDQPRPVKNNYFGKTVSFSLDAQVGQSIKEFAQSQQVTLFTFLFSVFCVLLHRYSGQEDLLVGTPVANRNHSELEKLIGYFVNPLVLRSNAAGNPPFGEFLKRINSSLLQAFANQDLPFEELVQELNIDSGFNHNPVFQVVFALENVATTALDLTDVKAEAIRLDYGVSKFDFTFTLKENANSFDGYLEYNTDLFQESTIKRFIEHFKNLLTAILAKPETTLAALPLQSPAELQQILIDWNQTTTQFPSDCIHQIFEQYVASHPSAAAVIQNDKTLSYAELNNKANQLAHYLRSTGVGADQPVVICVEQSFDLMIGILAILKAGGAYVPLDPEYPHDRLQYMVQDSQTKILLTQSHLSHKFLDFTGEVLCLDTEQEKFSQLDAANLANNVTAKNLCYVIYTSGSTGKPKGVMVEHQGVVRLVKNTNYISVTPQDRVSQACNISFDATTFEYWGALLNGAALVLIPKDTLLNPDSLAKTIKHHSVTAMVLTTRLFDQIILADPKTFSGVDHMLLGGEALNPATIAAAIADTDFAPKEIINIYGPTENTDITTTFSVKPGDNVGSNIPIGRPIANTQVYILDKYLQPQPIGVPGELCAAGIGVARGYYNRPDLTSKVFVNNPFSDNEDQIYMTGDLCRYLPDGNIEYIGRVDHQIKLRGYRIELGEIETAIKLHPAVSNAVAIVQESSTNEKFLTAYYVPDNEKISDQTLSERIESVRRFTKERLPDYMVPSFIIELEQLPITPNGKLDRKRLPKPEDELTTSSQYVAPRNEQEEVLTNIWAEILGIKRIGVFDNFFELGGHSLLATKLVSRIRRLFNVEIPIRELFNSPTIVTLLSYINANYKQSLLLPKIHQAPQDATLFLSHAQQRLWVLAQMQANDHTYNVPMTLKLSGKLNIEAFTASINAVVQRHASLRTHFVNTDQGPIQIIADHLQVMATITDFSKLDIEAKKIKTLQWIDSKIKTVFVLDQAPLFSVDLLRVSNDVHIVVFNMHHIITDGWSQEIFLRELNQYYNAYIANEELILPALEFQYADYVYWRNQVLQGNRLDNHLEYWKQQLADAPVILELPTDYLRPPIQTTKGINYRFVFNSQLTTALRNLTRQQNCTLYAVLLTAFSLLLHRYTRQEDLLVGTPVTHRNREELEAIIGFFVNTLVIRSQLSSDMSFNDMLNKTHNHVLDAFNHRDLPFDMLVDALHLDRDASRNPLIQVMFVLQGQAQALQFKDLDAQVLEIDLGISKFDLTLLVEEQTDELHCLFEYNTDLFKEQTIARMAEHLEILLTAIVQDPTQIAATLPLLTAPEEHQLLVEWNQTETQYRDDLAVHELFAEQVKHHPDVLCVQMDAQRFTYKQVDQRANQLANYLLTHDLKIEDRVALCLGRSPENIIAMLAVGKAGGAYLPVDPEYPDARLHEIITDTQTKIVITFAKWQSRFSDTAAHVVIVDDNFAAVAKQVTIAPKVKVTNRNLVYCISTSGSTGKPKTVAIEQRGLINLIFWQHQHYRMSVEDRCLIARGPAFDAANIEIWPALTIGASLHICDHETRIMPNKMLQYLADNKITMCDLPPPLVEAMFDEQWPNHMELRHIMVGGDKLQRLPPENATFSLHNHYGPSEDTILTTHYAVPTHLENSVSPPIGKPISNHRVYVLDDNLQLVPTGVVGELYIAGIGLARGYLNHDELTAERFIENPFSIEPDDRLYKTGDLVRYRDDGNLEFVGRCDHQVKIRGFRIELGEIEQRLQAHAAIKQCFVITQTINNDHHLVAYYLTRTNTVTDATLLREYLKQYLPDYMVPGFFVEIDHVPLTLNGKLDRKRLPLPKTQDFILHQYVAPRNDTEKSIAEIWEKILKISQIGIHDNFFTIGGHSILAARVMQAISKQFDKVLPLSSFFENPTIANLAIYLTADTDQAAPREDWQKLQVLKDAELTLTFSPDIKAAELEQPHAILLTGASGFLGAHLLHDLLFQTGAQIYCLIRANSIDEAKQRLLANLNLYGFKQTTLSKRIIPVLGDLAAPQLGLSNQVFDDLSQNIDWIYHNGALVHSVYSYDAMRDANVIGTLAILKIAMTYKIKPLNFVSTLTAAYQRDENNLYAEVMPSNDPGHLSSGYALTKWVGERLMQQAGELGVPVRIFRPGRISGQTNTGIALTNDTISILIKGCIQLGFAPDIAMHMDMAPVDYVSGAIVEISFHPQTAGQVFHLYNPHGYTWKQLVAWINQYGFPLKLITPQAWQEKLKHIDETNAIYPMLPVFLQPIPEQSIEAEKPDTLTTHTQAALQASGLECPVVTPELLQIYFDYWEKCGFVAKN